MEHNAANIYEARRYILALCSEIPSTACQSEQQLSDSCPHLHSNRHVSSPLSSGKILFVLIVVVISGMQL